MSLPRVAPLDLDMDDGFTTGPAAPLPALKSLDIDLDMDMDTRPIETKPFSFSDSDSESEDEPDAKHDEVQTVPDVLPEHDLRVVPAIEPARLRETRSNVAQTINKVFIAPVQAEYNDHLDRFASFADDTIDPDAPGGIELAAKELVVIIKKRRPEKYASECLSLPWSFVDQVLLNYHSRLVKLDGAMVKNIGACTAGMECQGALAARAPEGPVHLAVYKDNKKFMGGPLVQLVTPDEHAAWKRSKGTLRLPQRMCIYCYWQSIVRAIGTSEFNPVSRDDNIAAYVVPTNCEDGYNKNLCIGPSEKSISALHGFIPLMQYTLLSIDYRESTATWYINHTSFRYDMGTECYPPPSIEVARRISDTRVSHLTTDVTAPAPELRGDTIFAHPLVSSATPRNMKAIGHLPPAGQAMVAGK